MEQAESAGENARPRARTKREKQLQPSAPPPPHAPVALPEETLTKTHFELAEELDYANRIQLFNAIAEQIWREQQLVSTRMQWNFTFQAFLAGIYVFAGSNLEDLPRSLVQGVLCLAGFVVTLFCLFGVIAAQDQSTRLKEHWAEEFHPHPRPTTVGECNIKRGAFPQPFSSNAGSGRGRLASRGVCYALMAMWAALLAITIGIKAYLPQKVEPAGYACQLKPSTNSTGDITISCEANTQPNAPAHKPAPTEPAQSRPKP